MPKRGVPLHCLALAALLLGSLGAGLSARSLDDRRLPKGYHWGRCLLVVQGQRRISGRCSYALMKGGEFEISGPREIYGEGDLGIGRGGPPYFMEAPHSEDYWASVFRDPDGSWDGYGNDDIAATHANGFFGPLHREGACWVNATARVCLWKK